MRLITIDFETYYAKDYTLSKLTTEEYIRDDRFEAIGVGIKVNDEATTWHTDGDIRDALLSHDYSDAAILCHNTMFDGAILSWHYGINPKLWLDTLGMSRPKYKLTVGGSLAALVKALELGEKGTEVVAALGRRRKDFTIPQLAAYGGYCRNDVGITHALFKKLSKGFPISELMLIDQIIRMYTEPVLELDRGLLIEHLAEVQGKKQALLDKLGGEEAAKKVLMSNPKFAKLLTALGVAPPRKVSLTTGKETYAFAKTDPGFKALLSHSDPTVQLVAEVRVGVKSTIEETRTQRLIGVSERGPLPIMLNYYGAHTGRLSGGEKLNLQNLPTRAGGNAIRRAICAPQGHTIIACDSSQIEARILACIAGQDDLVAAFAAGRDVYSEFAGEVYGCEVTKEDKPKRTVGKTGILGLGYNMGAARFQETLAAGTLGPPVVVDEVEAKRTVDTYRRRNHKIKALWKACDHVLGAMVAGSSGVVAKVCSYDPTGVLLPNGLRMLYPMLHSGVSGYSYVDKPAAYRKAIAGGEVKRNPLYGGKLVENITQALARIVITDQMRVIGGRYRVLFQVHDEIIICVLDDEAAEARRFMEEIMSRTPTWLPELPIACESGVGANYGDAK